MPGQNRAGGARISSRQYSYLLSSYSAATCEPLPQFATARGAGAAGDKIRHAQPGIRFTLLVREHGGEWRTHPDGRTIQEALAGDTPGR